MANKLCYSLESGTQYGRITVIGQVSSTRYGVRRAVCHMACGHESVITVNTLVRSKSGLCHKCWLRKHNNKQRAQTMARVLSPPYTVGYTIDSAYLEPAPEYTLEQFRSQLGVYASGSYGICVAQPTAQ